MRKDISGADGPFIGAVIRILQDKGFAFVQRRDQPGTERPDEYFLHRSGMGPGEFDELVLGQSLKFMGKRTDKGLRVTEAERYEGEVPQADPLVSWDREGRRERGRR
jgi:cold shock CspA family protein